MKRLLLVFVLLWPVSLLADFQAAADAYYRKDFTTAYREILPLAEQGNARAQFWLGVMYNHAKGVPQDYRQAISWYRKAADQGLAEAQYGLGRMYDYGLGVSEDDGQAVYWFRKAADQGNARTQF